MFGFGGAQKTTATNQKATPSKMAQLSQNKASFLASQANKMNLTAFKAEFMEEGPPEGLYPVDLGIGGKT